MKNVEKKRDISLPLMKRWKDSEDEKIEPEGLEEYKVQPPMPMEPAQAPPLSNSVDEMDKENETNVIEDEVQQEQGVCLRATNRIEISLTLL